MNRSLPSRHLSIAWSCGGFAVLLAAGAACPAATVNVTGTLATPPQATGVAYIGRAEDGTYYAQGNEGAPGYAATSGSDTYQINAVVTGGKGADLNASTSPVPNFSAGFGGTALQVTSTTAVINGGTYTAGHSGTATYPNGQTYTNASGRSMAAENAKLTFNGGTFRDNLLLQSSDVTFNGGTFGSNVTDSGFGVQLNNLVTSVTNVNGGTFVAGNSSGLYFPSSAIAVSQGNISVRGGTFDIGTNSFALNLFNDVTATLYGTAFVVNGVPVLTSGTVSPTTGIITGLLQNNALPSSLPFSRYAESPINLVIVPEPTAIGTLAGGAVLGLRRRRQA